MKKLFFKLMFIPLFVISISIGINAKGLYFKGSSLNIDGKSKGPGKVCPFIVADLDGDDLYVLFEKPVGICSVYVKEENGIILDQFAVDTQYPFSIYLGYEETPIIIEITNSSHIYSVTIN